MQLQLIDQVSLGVFCFSLLMEFGLKLEKEDILKIFDHKRKITFLVLSQYLLAPPVAFFLGKYLNLNEAHQLGLIMLSITPVGALTNIINKSVDGNLSLGMGLTLFSTILSCLTLPAVTSYLITGGKIPIIKILGITCFLISPVLIGAFLTEKMSQFFRKLVKIVFLSSTLIAGVRLVILLKESLLSLDRHVVMALFMYPIILIVLIYFISFLTIKNKKDSRTIASGLGGHNSPITLIILGYNAVLIDQDVFVLPLLYSIMFFPYGLIVNILLYRLLDKRNPRERIT